MKPRIPITDKRFKYVPSSNTDVRETMRKERERLQQERSSCTTIPFVRRDK